MYESYFLLSYPVTFAFYNCNCHLLIGIDCPDIRQVIHWPVLVDLETCVQESGRDNAWPEAILYYSAGKYVNEETRAYGTNKRYSFTNC